MRLLAPGASGFAGFLRLAAASAYKVPELRAAARLWWERPLPADFRPIAVTAKRSPAVTFAEPGMPIEHQDPQSVRILDRIVARLGERFTVDGVRSGHGYRVVDLRSSATDRVFTGLPVGTLLTTVSLRHSGEAEIIGDHTDLRAAIRDNKRPQEQYRAIRQYVADSIDEITADEQARPRKAVPARPATPAEAAALARDLAAVDEMLPAPTTPPARAPGLFWRVGDRWFGDTALIPSNARHMLYGDFEATLPGGRLYFSRWGDDKSLPGQSGRLHELSLREGSDLPGVLEGLVAKGLAQSGGVWDEWPRAAGEVEAPAGVETKQLAATTKHLTAGALQVQKKPQESTLQIGSGGRHVSVPTAAYVPIPLDTNLSGDMQIPLDSFMGLLDRTIFAVSTDANRTNLHLLAFKATGERLTAFATDSHVLALASLNMANAAALDGQTIAYPALVRLHKLLQEYAKTARSGRRAAKGTAAPPLRLQTSSVDPRRLAISTELFTFVAARPLARPISFETVIPPASNLATLCIVHAAELLSAMKPLASAKETAELRVNSPLEITSDTFNFNLRDVYIDGPPLVIRVSATYIRDALEGLQAGGPYVALAFTTPGGPIVVLAWPDPALPVSRRDARGPLLAALESHNLTVVMPTR